MAWSDAARAAAARARDLRNLSRIGDKKKRNSKVTLSYNDAAFHVSRSTYAKQLRLQRFAAKVMGTPKNKVRSAAIRSLFIKKK